MRTLVLPAFSLVMVLWLACGSGGSEESVGQQEESGTCTPIEGDDDGTPDQGPGDIGVDENGDPCVLDDDDLDSDNDTDTDTDGDVDTDSDTDGDVDTDTDSDNDLDTDSDSDSDNDAGAPGRGRDGGVAAAETCAPIEGDDDGTPDQGPGDIGLDEDGNPCRLDDDNDEDSDSDSDSDEDSDDLQG